MSEEKSEPSHAGLYWAVFLLFLLVCYLIGQANHTPSSGYTEDRPEQCYDRGIYDC